MGVCGSALVGDVHRGRRDITLARSLASFHDQNGAKSRTFSDMSTPAVPMASVDVRRATESSERADQGGVESRAPGALLRASGPGRSTRFPAPAAGPASSKRRHRIRVLVPGGPPVVERKGKEHSFSLTAFRRKRNAFLDWGREKHRKTALNLELFCLLARSAPAGHNRLTQHDALR